MHGIWQAREGEGYAENFGLQWNTFQVTQFDSHSGHPLTKERLLAASGWSFNDLKSMLVIELGSGAGRFTEILKDAGALVVSVEMSSAITANQKNNDSENILFIKSSLFEVDFLFGLFDFVLCYGVAQHTPAPKDCYKVCCALAKPGGRISVDHYSKGLYYYTSERPKHLWRLITTRMKPQTLLKFIRWYIPKYLPFDTLLIRFLPRYIKIIVRAIIPILCVNYYGDKHPPR